MTAALFGSLGVLLGGAINFWVQSKLAERNELGELRAALRLVSTEIRHADVALETSKQQETLWSFSGVSLVTASVWERALPPLASHLSDDAWFALANTYLDLRAEDAWAQGLVARDEPPWADNYVVEVDGGLAATAHGAEALDRLTGEAWTKELGRA